MVVVVGSTQLCGHPNFVLCWSWVVTIFHSIADDFKTTQSTLFIKQTVLHVNNDCTDPSTILLVKIQLDCRKYMLIYTNSSQEDACVVVKQIFVS